MEKQIIKINSKGKIVRLCPLEDGKMKEDIFTESEFFAMWLNNICEKGRVRDFHFESDDSVHIDFLSIGKFSVGPLEIQLVLDESALDNEKFMGKLYYLEEVFCDNEELWKRRYAETFEREKQRVVAANTCYELLRKCCNGEDLGNVEQIANPHMVLSYFYSHKREFKDYASKILTPKQNKWSDIFAAGTIISGILLAVSLIAFFTILLTNVTGLPALIDGIALLCSFCGCMFFLSIEGTYNEGELDAVFPKFIESFEDVLVMGRELSKREEFECIVEKTREYIRESEVDFQNESAALDALLESLGQEKKFDSNERLEDIKRLLEIEWQIYSKEERFGQKSDTPYVGSYIEDILDYIGFDDEESDEILDSLKVACIKVLEEPFYGCELEATRLVQAIINYVEEMRKYASREEFVKSPNYRVSLEGYRSLISEAYNMQERALKRAVLLEAREQIIASAVPQVATLQGEAMQMMPVDKKKE